MIAKEREIERLLSKVVKLCGEMCKAADRGDWERYNKLKAKRYDLLKKAVQLDEDKARPCPPSFLSWVERNAKAEATDLRQLRISPSSW